MPAVAIVVGIVVWAPDEIARQYKFEKLATTTVSGSSCLLMAIALFLSACAVQLLRLVRDKVVDSYTALRRRSAIRRALADLTPDEVVVMFALLTITRMPSGGSRQPCCPKAARVVSRVRPCG
jgi:hypothetical protein